VGEVTHDQRSDGERGEDGDGVEESFGRHQ
jgi:hypothetical protein